MKMKFALWGIGVAAAVVVLIAITASVVISRCANDFRCISQFQYAYLSVMNKAIAGYGGDIFSCSAAATPQGVEFLTAEGMSNNQRTCRKIDKSSEGIITRVIQASSLRAANEEKKEVKSEGEYLDEDFGVAFKKIDRSDVVIKKDKDIMTATSASGSIQRFPIPQGKSFPDVVVDLMPSKLCRITLYPWLPNAINDATPGEISLSVSASDMDTYQKKATNHLKPLKFEGLDYALEEAARIRDLAVSDCSPYVNTSEEGGYFLYDPIEAPDHFYYVKRTSKAGDPNFYEWDTVRILKNKTKTPHERRTDKETY